MEKEMKKKDVRERGPRSTTNERAQQKRKGYTAEEERRKENPSQMTRDWRKAKNRRGEDKEGLVKAEKPLESPGKPAFATATANRSERDLNQKKKEEDARVELLWGEADGGSFIKFCAGGEPRKMKKKKRVKKTKRGR